MSGKRTLGLVVGVALVACGSETPGSETPSESSPTTAQAPAAESSSASTEGPRDGGAPEVARILLEPSEPIGGDEISLRFDLQDPDGDPVETQIDWYVNRQLYSEDGGTTLGTDELLENSEIYVVIRASDGQHDVLRQSGTIFLRNAPPVITAIEISPQKPTGTQTLVAETRVSDREGNDPKVEFQWILNGAPIPGEHGSTLQPGKTKRGDRVSVSAAAIDAARGPELTSDEVEIGNSPPEIKSKPSTALAGPTLYRYEIQAEDPDGDRPLRYDLVDGPDGMSVDLVSGLVEWEIPSDASGTIPIEVAVRDPYGGEERQAYVLELNWQDVSDKDEKSDSASDSSASDSDSKSDSESDSVSESESDEAASPGNLDEEAPDTDE